MTGDDDIEKGLVATPPERKQGEIVYPSHLREKLEEVARLDVASDRFGGLYPVNLVYQHPEKQRLLRGAVEKILGSKEYPKDTTRFLAQIPNWAIPLRDGDIILDLVTGVKIRVGDEPLFLSPSETSGELIAAKNGDNQETVPIFSQGNREMVTRPISTGRIKGELRSFFRKVPFIVGTDPTLRMQISIEISLFGETSENKGRTIGESVDRERLLKQQSQVAVKSKDGHLFLPQTEFLGDFVIENPDQLATFIYDNEIFSRVSDIGHGSGEDKITLSDIVWLVSRRAIASVVATHEYQELFVSDTLGILKPEIEQETIEAIDRETAKIGLRRDPATTDIYIPEQTSGDSFRGGRFRMETMRIPDEKLETLLAYQIAQTLHDLYKTGLGVNPIAILEYNPGLRRSKDVRVPPTIKLYGLPAFIASISLYDESLASELAREVVRRIADLKSPDDLDNWLHEIQDTNARDFEYLGQNVPLMLIGEQGELPGAIDWWKKLIREVEGRTN
jgi:hypothetical protein